MAAARRERDSGASSAKIALARRDEAFDEVPAAVVCALCGDAECTGCVEEPTRSGVVAVVPWERPGAPALARLWGTARVATVDAERFFESLPDGPVTPALRFAVLCELLASAGLVACAAIAVALAAPIALHDLLVARGAALAPVALVAVPGLAAVLVLAHAVHGVVLGRGAGRPGGRNATSRALRFGLYASGWDLTTGPVGAIVSALRDGRAAAAIPWRQVVGLPSRAARAYLRGAHKLEGESAARAARIAYASAVGTLVVGLAALIVGLAAALTQ